MIEKMRQNLQTSARFYTEQNDLVVRFGGETATDMKKTIFLRYLKDEITPGIPATPAECWIVMKSTNAHESAHILFSHRKAWAEACSRNQLFRHIVNILEDSRVEKAIANMYPGTKLWIRFANEYFFKNHKFTKEGLEAFIDGLLCYAVVGLVPDGLNKEVNQAIEDCMSLVDKARNTRSTWDVLEIAEEILEIAKRFSGSDSIKMPMPKGFNGSDSPIVAPLGNEDPRKTVKPKVSCDILEKPKKRPEEETKDENESESELEPEAGVPTDSKQENKTEGTNETTGNMEGKPAGKPAKDDSGKPSVSDNKHDENTEDEDTEDAEMKEIVKIAEKELGKIEVDKKREAKVATKNEPTKIDYEKLVNKISKGIHAGIGFQLKRKHPEPVFYDAYASRLSSPIKKLVEEIKKSLEFRDSMPRRGLKRGHLDPSALWKTRIPSPEVFYRKEEPGDIPKLAVELLVDCSGSMGKESRMDAAVKAAIMLHETCNQLKIQHTVEGFTSILCPAGIKVIHYKAVDWGEECGYSIASLTYQIDNRDGYSIRVAGNELKTRPEPVKLLIVLSDGMPQDKGGYSEKVALVDTAKAVRELKKIDIRVIGIYFGEEENVKNARQIYHHLVYCKDVESLPTILGRVFKKALLG
mgnify:CR=1 FL=1